LSNSCNLSIACLCMLLCKYDLYSLNIRLRASFNFCLIMQCFRILWNCFCVNIEQRLF
jgi:hypothetical protein